MLDFVTRMFSLGYAALPAAGGWARCPSSSRRRLPAGTLRLGDPVERGRERGGRAPPRASASTARAVVVAADGSAAAAGLLDGVEAPRWRSTACLYFDAPEPPVEGADPRPRRRRGGAGQQPLRSELGRARLRARGSRARLARASSASPVLSDAGARGRRARRSCAAGSAPSSMGGGTCARTGSSTRCRSASRRRSSRVTASSGSAPACSSAATTARAPRSRARSPPGGGRRARSSRSSPAERAGSSSSPARPATSAAGSCTRSRSGASASAAWRAGRRRLPPGSPRPRRSSAATCSTRRSARRPGRRRHRLLPRPLDGLAGRAFEEEDRRAAGDLRRGRPRRGGPEDRLPRRPRRGGSELSPHLAQPAGGRPTCSAVPGVPVVELRASIVIGSGSLSFELVRAPRRAAAGHGHAPLGGDARPADRDRGRRSPTSSRRSTSSRRPARCTRSAARDRVSYLGDHARVRGASGA